MSARKYYKVFHDTPKDYFADYILLPLGYSYNREFLTLTEGQLLRFGDGKVYRFLRSGILDINSPGTDGLCFARYGITLKKAMRIWRINALAQGYGVNAISEKECLIIIYGEEIYK